MKHEQILNALITRATGETTAEPAASLLSGTAVIYVNELGSTASFTFNSNGTVTGTYTSKVSSGGGTISGQIIGWYSYYLIGWVVTWPTNPPSMTTWVGEATSSGTIDTMWYLVSQSSTPGSPQFWSAVNAGSDLFTIQ